MHAENWKTIKEVLLEALKLDASRRQDYLERADITPEIREEVESLLVLEAEAEDFMSLPVGEFSKDFLDQGEPAAVINQKIGVYEIVAELGFGGMGAVYLATRADGKFEQRVAIKMLKREFNTEKIRRNFQREKEILATLAHPNIATLLDAGTTADGIPYLVMEYVEGRAIDEFCQRRKLSLNARLKLFNKVCEAVAFAHRNLIIHRDLKPSNILVTKDGEPKLLDFGISKLLDAEAEDANIITNLVAMTPQYASPEQIKGEPVTTATDVYSLGVVLFKILTESFPYNFGNKTDGNLFREITEAAPTLPSEVALISESPILPYQLKGDLDNIVLKSLRKEPERRYKTVEQFSADLWRYVDGLPVLARPATFSYRASKFYGRNKVSVLAAALILISLFAGIAVAVSQANAAKAQARIASEAQRQAEVETERAKAEEEKAVKISNFMAKVFSYANPAWYAEGSRMKGEAKVIDVMNEMSDKIDAEFPEHPDIRAELHHRFTEVFGAYGKPWEKSPRSENARIKAQFHARRALELRRQFYGDHHELVAKDLVYYYWTFPQEPAAGAKMLAEAINMMRETNPKNLNLPYMLVDYAYRLVDSDYNDEGFLQSAIPMTAQEFNEAYRRAALPPTTEDKYQLAERYLKEALPIFREHYEDNYAIVLNECNLAFVLIKQNKRAEFDEHYQICKQNWVNYPPDPANPISTLDRIEEVLATNNR